MGYQQYRLESVENGKWSVMSLGSKGAMEGRLTDYLGYGYTAEEMRVTPDPYSDIIRKGHLKHFINQGHFAPDSGCAKISTSKDDGGVTTLIFQRGGQFFKTTYYASRAELEFEWTDDPMEVLCTEVFPKEVTTITYVEGK